MRSEKNKKPRGVFESSIYYDISYANLSFNSLVTFMYLFIKAKSLIK